MLNVVITPKIVEIGSTALRRLENLVTTLSWLIRGS
jgi:hypothetical protein